MQSMWKNSRKFGVLVGAFLFGVAMSLVGCGASSGGTGIGSLPVGAYPGYLGINCAGGFNPTGFGCVLAPDFATACNLSNGISAGISASYNGSDGLCHVTATGAVAFTLVGGAFPYVTDSTPQLGYRTSTNLIAGDTVFISGSGGWGWNNCSQVGLDGNSYNGGELNGLMISDGYQAYYMGYNGSRTVTNSGTLEVGFNTSPGTGSCATASLQVSIRRCLDVNGYNHSC